MSESQAAPGARADRAGHRRLGVVGITENRQDWLDEIGQAKGFDIVEVLPPSRVRKAPSFDIEQLLADARTRMIDEQVDAVTTYWDFPSSCLVPILAEEFGLPTPGLRPTLIFEHKLWSRLVQQKVAPESTPPFVGVDIFDDEILDAPPLPYPFWLKPVKSFSGYLGFRIRSRADLLHAVGELRASIGWIGNPFQQVLERLDDLPEPIAALDGTAAIAEGLIDGAQCTLEGHVTGGEVAVHGIFDIHRGADGSSFTHYTYPSRLPDWARESMGAIAADLMHAADYRDAAFNIEFFVDEEQQRTWILEVNPRISQEHSNLMGWVDNATNLQVMSECAFGEPSTLDPGEGSCPVAAKFFLRHHSDAIAQHVPDAREIAALEEAHAPCEIEMLVHTGVQLSTMPEQEPYSYVVAYVTIGGESFADLEETYEHLVDQLSLTFADLH